MKLDNIFFNYIASQKLDLDLDELTTYCYDHKKNNQSVLKSNYGGWQSNKLNLNDEKLQSVINSIVRVSIDIINYYQLSDPFFVENVWININGKYDYNRPHIHSSSVISGCFYIKAPKDCGNLVLQNPNSRIACFEENFNRINPLIYSHYDIVPEENMIYMFPSWIEHYVEPNRSDEDRISMAFNIGVKNDRNETDIRRF